MIPTQYLWLEPLQGIQRQDEAYFGALIAAVADDDLAGACCLGDIVQIFGKSEMKLAPSCQARNATHSLGRIEVRNSFILLEMHNAAEETSANC